MGWGGAASPGGGADSSASAPGGGLGSGAFGGEGPSVTGQGAASDTSTMEGFRAALARALGQVTQEQEDAAVEAQNNLDANNRAMAAAVEARDKTQREAKAQKEREALMSQLDALMGQTNFATPTDAVENTNPQTAIEDPSFSTPQSALDAAALAAKNAKEQREREAIAGHIKGKSISVAPANAVESPGQPQNPYDIEDVDVVIDDSFFDEDETGLVNPRETAQSFREIEAKKMGVDPDLFTGTKNSFDNREPVDMYGRVAPIEDIEDPEHKAKAYEVLAKLQKEAKEAQTPLGKALRNIFGLAVNAVPGMGMLNMLGKAVKAGLGMLGMNVDPNIIGQAIRQAHEITTQGPLGAGGTSVGSRNDSFIEEFIRQLPASAYKEPWMKGLNEQQVQYYFDRPEELEWVRNLWSSMNPTTAV